MSRDNHQDEIQRALNESKKRRLEERYGGRFSSTGPDLPPEVEAEWLDNIEEFEQQFEQAGQTTVGKYVGDPVFKRCDEVAPDELEAELSGIVEILASNNIEVHFDASVPAAERYRFIIEELLNEEMDDIRVDGMTQHFIYEEFHPNHKLDAELEAEMFVREILSHEAETRLLSFSNHELYTSDGTPLTPEQMLKRVDNFREGIAVFLEKDIGQARSNVEEEYASVQLPVSWEGLRAESMEPMKESGTALVRLRREDEQWCVVQASVPGFQM
jgi:hypothetical protein